MTLPLTLVLRGVSRSGGGIVSFAPHPSGSQARLPPSWRRQGKAPPAGTKSPLIWRFFSSPCAHSALRWCALCMGSPPRGKAGRRPVYGQHVTNAKTGRSSYVDMQKPPFRERGLCLMPPSGFEPLRLAAQDSKSCVSANFTTAARVSSYHSRAEKASAYALCVTGFAAGCFCASGSAARRSFPQKKRATVPGPTCEPVHRS